MYFLDATGHQGPVTCIDCHKDGTLIATGAEDTKSKIINSTTGKVSTTLLQRQTPTITPSLL